MGSLWKIGGRIIPPWTEARREMRFLKAPPRNGAKYVPKMAVMAGIRYSPIRNDPDLLGELSVRMLKLGDKPSTQYWEGQAEPDDTFVMENAPFKKSNKPGRELAAIQGPEKSMGIVTIWFRWKEMEENRRSPAKGKM